MTNYEYIQRKYCSNSSGGPKTGDKPSRMGLRAIRHAMEAATWLRSPVVALGCGDGTEILTLAEFGIDKIIGVEVVRERVERGKASGLDIRHGRAENLFEKSLNLKGKFDVYAAHVLEHCEDLGRAIVNIKRIMGVGNRVVIYSPVEPGPGRSANQAHFSKIQSVGKLFDMFSPAQRHVRNETFCALQMEYRFDLEPEFFLVMEKVEVNGNINYHKSNSQGA